MIRTRFAPSPTGDLHIGGLRTALYSYALAKHQEGKFVLRIEDTDKKREVPRGKEKIQKILKTFGLNWDEYYVQSELAKDGRYKKAAEDLVKKGRAFYCICKPKNTEKGGFSKELRDSCRDKNLKTGAVKLKIPENQKISFKDYVLGKEIAWNSNAVSDTTLLKSDGMPTYHLAVVVDDYKMEITHVLRGHDWLPSTPVHLLVYDGLNYKVPEIGHLTDILDPEGGKLSKRKGSTSCEGLLTEGYLPEAILNFVMLLGWAPKNNQEIFSLKEFVDVFDPSGFQKTNPVFNQEKLDWFNGEYIRKLDLENLETKISQFFEGKYPSKQLKRILPLVRDRIKTLKEFESLAGFFFKWQKPNLTLFGNNYKEHLAAAAEAIAENRPLEDIARERKFDIGDFFMDLRIVITGSKITPPINESIEILGKEESLRRIKEFI